MCFSFLAKGRNRLNDRAACQSKGHAYEQYAGYRKVLGSNSEAITECSSTKFHQKVAVSGRRSSWGSDSVSCPRKPCYYSGTGRTSSLLRGVVEVSKSGQARFWMFVSAA